MLQSLCLIIKIRLTHVLYFFYVYIILGRDNLVAIYRTVQSERKKSFHSFFGYQIYLFISNFRYGNMKPVLSYFRCKMSSRFVVAQNFRQVDVWEFLLQQIVADIREPTENVGDFIAITAVKWNKDIVLDVIEWMMTWCSRQSPYFFVFLFSFHIFSRYSLRNGSFSRRLYVKKPSRNLAFAYFGMKCCLSLWSETKWRFVFWISIFVST